MGGFLSELGKKLAERWVSLLVLPGALYLAVAATAHTLGHTHPFDLPHLTHQIATWANHPATSTAGGQVVLLAAILAAAAAAGLAAQALGSLAEWLCLAADWPAWPPPLRQLAARQTTRRRNRWARVARIWHQHRDEAARTLVRGQRADPAGRHAAERAMTRIAPEEPCRPTWSGDRLNAVAVRLERDHHLDLATLWPHLWLILPEGTRAEITTTRQALIRATTLTAWALLYLPLAAWWWPAALIAVLLTLIGWARTRTATDTYALLLEATARLHTRDLADRLGLNPTDPLRTLTPEPGDARGLNPSGPLTPETGDALTHHLTPSAPSLPTG
ncbi:hypothetical protein RM550_35745 [Streptomyces sp. DSM 41527]|uniref:Vegetative cell wall protein gp1 n=1 Tax=Streptomyces mooreae TaxID=3075523 RepID=A0ABU2TJ85_9ACTN|nr:hypothetical protein [Streptomyces sp. DSM 41527]MDT0461004.1 hypothetical protein [Streptomyces sp. DSM 41527]